MSTLNTAIYTYMLLLVLRCCCLPSSCCRYPVRPNHGGCCLVSLGSVSPSRHIDLYALLILGGHVGRVDVGEAGNRHDLLLTDSRWLRVK